MRWVGKKHSSGKCINPDCPTHGSVHARGLCLACYQSLRRLILSGQFPSWEAAERAGPCTGTRGMGLKRFPCLARKKVPVPT